MSLNSTSRPFLPNHLYFFLFHSHLKWHCFQNRSKQNSFQNDKERHRLTDQPFFQYFSIQSTKTIFVPTNGPTHTYVVTRSLLLLISLKGPSSTATCSIQRVLTSNGSKHGLLIIIKTERCLRNHVLSLINNTHT